MNKLNKAFRINPLYETDAYKIGHKAMLAKDTIKLYGTWIPRKLNYLPKEITKIMSVGQQFIVRWLHSNFQESFFDQPIKVAEKFVSDMSKLLNMEYDGKHFLDLHKLGYLPIKIKSLPEGISTNPNIPHMTFVNTVDGYGWLTLFLETYISKLAWRMPTAATIAQQYRKIATEWVTKTDKDNLFLVDYMCHDFHSRGGSPFDSLVVGLAHNLSFAGSDTLNTIPAARYFYDEPEDSVTIASVNASEHSVSCTKIFTVGEKQMIIDWCKEFPTGILSIVADTFDLWKLITEYLPDPEVKEAILARYGKLVIRPDSGNPVDIICGIHGNGQKGAGTTKDYADYYREAIRLYDKQATEQEYKGVVELLWDIFGGTVNEQGYRVLDSHIGAIYGDSINLERQVQMYSRLAEKQFASTCIVLGVGSYQYIGSITRDSAGYAAKASWFEVKEHRTVEEFIQDLNTHRNLTGEDIDAPYESNEYRYKSYNIYKDPITDDGTKKSLKGRIAVFDSTGNGDYFAQEECTDDLEASGELQTIYEDGRFSNITTLTEIRERINKNL
jgi:nicotinamide phosphoribosyltransferase